MLGLSANLHYYLFNGNVDLRKGIFRLCESIREEMSLAPSDASNVYIFMSRNRKVVKILHIGCWTHCRRLWVDALLSDRTAMDIIDPIGDMFRNEDQFRMMKLSSEQIKEKRLKLTGPILE